LFLQLTTICYGATTMSDAQELLKLAASRYVVLMALFPDEEMTQSELAKETRVDKGNLSEYVKDLKEQGLIALEERKALQDGRKRSCYRLTADGKEILGTVERIVKRRGGSVLEPIDRDLVELCLRALDPELRNEKLRSRLASRFSELCAKTRVWDHPRVEDVFKRIVESPKDFLDESGGYMRLGLKKAVPRMLEDEKMRDWAVKNLYAGILKNVGHRGLDLELRASYMDMLDWIFVFDEEKRGEIIETTYSACMEPEVTLGSSFYVAMKPVIYRCSQKGFEDFRGRVLEWLFRNADSEDASRREKAEDLIAAFLSPGETGGIFTA